MLFRSVPCIGTNVGGIPEVIKNKENGYIVELGDCESVAEYGVEILQNPTLHKQIVDRSLEIIQDRFSSNNIVEQYEEMYERVARK